MSAPAPAPAANSTITLAEKVPSAATLVSAAKLAIQKDMPIQLDYFVDSADGKAFHGEDAQTGEKMIVKNSKKKWMMNQLLLNEQLYYSNHPIGAVSVENDAERQNR